MLVRMTIINNGVKLKQNKKNDKKEEPQVITRKTAKANKKKIQFRAKIKTSFLIPSRLLILDGATSRSISGLEISSPKINNTTFITVNMTKQVNRKQLSTSQFLLPLAKASRMQ